MVPPELAALLKKPEALSFEYQERLVVLLTEPGVCDACGREGALHRSSTQYVDTLSNWHVLCEERIEEDRDYWSERWSDYYAAVW